jgi:hypothetical protein
MKESDVPASKASPAETRNNAAETPAAFEGDLTMRRK